MNHVYHPRKDGKLSELWWKSSLHKNLNRRSGQARVKWQDKITNEEVTRKCGVGNVEHSFTGLLGLSTGVEMHIYLFPHDPRNLQIPA